MKAELAEAKRQGHRFESRYGLSLARFESEILINQDSIQVHEDYNDWFYWQAVAEKNALAGRSTRLGPGMIPEELRPYATLLSAKLLQD